MKGLLLKDLYLTLKYCRAFLFIIVAFTAVSIFADENAFFIFYPCLISGILPMTLLAYDEREKWSVYSGTLPYTKAQIVSAKYIIGLIAGIFALILTALAQAVKMIGSSNFVLNDYFSLIICIMAVCLISPALLMPFIFKFGAEKGRVAYYIVIGAACAICAFFTVQENFSFATGGFYGILIIAAAAVILYLSSWLLSIYFYKRREI